MAIFGRKRPPVGRGYVPVDRIRELINRGVLETEIINILRNEGFSPEEIDKGLTEALKFRVEPKKEEEKKEVPTVRMELPKEEEEKEVPKEEEKEVVERPAFAPIFIKLDKYRHILNTINELKRTMITIKNVLGFLNEMERLREDSLKMIQESVGKIDKKLAALDAEFLRPSGFREEIPREEVYRVEAEPVALEGILSDLKSRIEELRSSTERL